MARKPRRERVEVTIDALGARGDGIARHKNKPLYISGALPGERVTAETGRPRGDGLEGRLVDVLQSSPSRREPPCRHAAHCGGCVLQHADEKTYSAWKHGLLTDALSRRGLDASVVEPLESAPLGSHRRLRFAVARRDQSHVPAFRAAHSHAPVFVQECPVASPALLVAARAAASALGCHGVDEVEVTETDTGIDLVCRSDVDPDLRTTETLQSLANDADLARIVWRAGKRPPYVVAEQRQPILTAGRAVIALPPGAFVQPTAWGQERIRTRIAGIVGRAQHIADLYAGCGMIGLALLPGRRLEMLEANDAMVRAGRAAAASSGLEAIAAARDLDTEPLAVSELSRFDSVILDPPRSGARAQCEALAASTVPTLAYASCHPGTFARDARILVDGGYRLERVWPLDQFLWSHHLELVAHFARR